MLVMLQGFQNLKQFYKLKTTLWFSINKIPPIELMINFTQISFNSNPNQSQTFAKTKVGAIVLSTQLPQ